MVMKKTGQRHGVWLYAAMAAYIISLSSCEKNINISVPAVASQVVVEGHIETGQGAYVVLTRSSGYFDPVDTATLLQSIVKNATVLVSDGLHTDTLPMIVDVNYASTTYIPLYYKKANPTVIGKTGGTYYLTVIADGKKLSSVTTIPTPVKLDSIWYKYQAPSDSLGFMWAHLSDPASEQNFYRWYAKRLHKDKKYLPPFGATFNDKFINGTSFNFAYNRGIEPGSKAKDDNNGEAGYFKKGDTVVVKFCSIDFYCYGFYSSYEAASASNGNPFGSPSNIRSNIQGGLGVWGGFSTTFDTIVNKNHP
ncbi:MAG TPA: DUF4249 domain-containing protein, partial [Bacteroidia bacterium]|nr:DUF4249 domain-containing protein [Bacteroidia bacterium]